MKIMVGGKHEDQRPLPGAEQIEVMVKQTFGTRDEKNLPPGWFTTGERHKREPHDVALYNRLGYALYERYVPAKVWVIEVATLEALFEWARVCSDKEGLLVRPPDEEEGNLPEAVPHECDR